MNCRQYKVVQIASLGKIIFFFRGHGTYVSGDKLIATVAGVVERVNKLICVRPFKTRYAITYN